MRPGKKEFYPTPVNHFDSDAPALVHSLKKWKGLRFAQLEKHSLVKANRSPTICDAKTFSEFRIDGDTCSLCYIHTLPNCTIQCSKCPLALVREGTPCDETFIGIEKYSPYTMFRDFSDPEPMIKWLKRALKLYPTKETV